MKVDIDALETAAKAATPGPWAWESVGEKCNAWCIGSTDPPHAGEIVEEYDEAASRYRPKPDVVDFVCESQDNFDNARFIAASSPDVVLALVARLRAAEASVEAAINFLLGRDWDMSPPEDCRALVDAISRWKGLK